MSPHTYILCSFALTFGVPMGIAVREYWQLGAPPGSLPPRLAPEPAPGPLPDAGAKPLPDCLIPRPVKIRELA